MPFHYYHNNPKFSSLDFLNLGDKEIVSFMIKEEFNVNKKWAYENPFLHVLLANEMFDSFERFLNLIPQFINPNLCDGKSFGKKSLLILATMMVSSGTLPLKLLKKYENIIDLNYQDDSGRTALHYAVILGRDDLVEALTQLGASTTLQDKREKKAFDYLFCGEACIQFVLKQIDIEPERDIHATRNKIKDHLERPLTLQGVQLIQKKSIVGNVLQAVSEGTCQLVKYIEGSDNWGTFIGDNNKATCMKMAELAQELASVFNKKMHKIWLNDKLSPQEQNKFFNYLFSLEKKLSGISVLSHCLGGHKVIAKYLEGEQDKSPNFVMN